MELEVGSVVLDFSLFPCSNFIVKKKKKESESNSCLFEVHIQVLNSYARFFLHARQVLSGSEWGNLLLWEGSLIKVELCRTGMKSCHQGPINQIMLDEGEVITAGSDGCVRVRQRPFT